MTMRLGILGGGQLARMLAQAAMRRGIDAIVLAKSERVPAAIEGVTILVGALDDEAQLDALFARCDVVTLENEFLDLECLSRVLERHPEVPLRPAVSGIAVAQDKLEQKRIFARLGFPTAEFETMHSTRCQEDLTRLHARFPEGFVLKQSRFGYDGKGNLVVDGPDDPSWGHAHAFCVAGEAVGATIYAERKIDFEAEVAMVLTRTPEGEHRHFPLVVSRQEKGVCREVLGPATALHMEAKLESRAADMLLALGEELELSGTYALELFVTKAGDLLVNEMAPRVHNTGHYTLFSDEPSQFDLHVEAVTGAALSDPGVRGLVAMRNLLGPWHVEKGLDCPAPEEDPPPGAMLVWYDKGTVSPGRKMGHLTARAETVDDLDRILDAMHEFEMRFWADLEKRQ